MKIKIILLIAALIITSPLWAQTEIITNSSIIKMSQARLTEDLIISVIEDSEVNFELDASGITELKNAKVSDFVIDAMKKAAGANTGTSGQQSNSSMLNANESRSVVEALGYVGPVTGLITFFEEDFKSMTETIAEWDNMITESISVINNLNREIAEKEEELANLKNADAGGYSDQIIELKKGLTESREKYKELKAGMLADGEEIAGRLSELSSQKVKSAGKEYSSVSQKIKSTGVDPANPDDPVSIELTSLTVPEGLNIYLSPVTELFYWYRNEITNIGEIIAEWNIKAENTVADYRTLEAKLEPVVSQLEEYEMNSKQYKDEISTLKDQKSDIEKEIKALLKQMENDRSELSDYIKEAGSTIQKIITERITDIISGINFLYHQKLNV